MLQWYDEKRGVWVEDTSCRFMLENGVKCNAKFLALLYELRIDW